MLNPKPVKAKGVKVVPSADLSDALTACLWGIHINPKPTQLTTIHTQLGLSDNVCVVQGLVSGPKFYCYNNSNLLAALSFE